MSEFIFADEYKLDQGPTRDFYQVFLKGLVHKHNNLMGVIQGFSSLILYEENLDESVRENAQQMQDSAKSAAELNKELLTAAGCVHFEKNMGTVQLGAMWPFLMEKCEGICTANGSSFQSNTKPDLPEITGENGYLSTIITNLVTNAAEAGEGTVAIDVFAPGEASSGNNIDLFVRNKSPEISPDELARAFEPFHTARTAEHFGLGLTSAAVLAGQMGMRLGIRYEDGTFTAWLAMPAA